MKIKEYPKKIPVIFSVDGGGWMSILFVQGEIVSVDSDLFITTAIHRTEDTRFLGGVFLGFLILGELYGGDAILTKGEHTAFPDFEECIQLFDSAEYAESISSLWG